MKSIDYLVVHCADTPNGREHTASDIHRWHKERNWDGIGYHAVITRSGQVQLGRPEYWPGAHVRAYNNHSLGVCLIGRDQFTPAQYQSLEILLNSWLSTHPNAAIVGHYQLDKNKTCPNFDVPAWLTSVGLPVGVNDE